MVFLRLTVKVYPRNPNAASTGSPACFLLTIENPENTSLGGLASLIQEKWKKLRPHEDALEIKKIVDDAHESTDLDPDMTVADVWVDIGKARSDNCDQRGTVRVVQKPTDHPHAPVRFPSVVHDWEAAAQDFQRQRRVKNEPGSPRMGTIPEEESQGEAEDSDSEESGSEEESDSEEETGSEEEAEEVEETGSESESDSVEEVAETAPSRQSATRDAESEGEEETDDEDGSEEGGAEVEPVADAKKDPEQEEETDDEEDEDSDDDEEEEKEEKEEDEADTADKHDGQDEDETGDEDESGEEESEESDGEEEANEMEVDEEEGVNEPPAAPSRLKRGRDADELQKPNKQPRLDGTGSRPRENEERSPEKRAENDSQPGLGLGITKSPPAKKPSMIQPSTPAARRGPLFQTNGTPSATLTPNTASQLPSALRKESPTQRSAVRRSVSFADEDDVVDLKSANKPKFTPQSASKPSNQGSTSSKPAAGAAADTSGNEVAENQEAIKKLEQEIESATKKGQTALVQHMNKILRHRKVLSNNLGSSLKKKVERAQRARDNVADLEKKLPEMQARDASSTSTPAPKKVGVVTPATAVTNDDGSKSVERDATPGPTFTSQMEAASENDEDSEESADDEPLQTQQVNLFSDTEEDRARTNGAIAKEQGRKAPAQKDTRPAPSAPAMGNKNKRTSLKSLLDDQKKEQQERVQSKEPPAPPRRQTEPESSSESESEDSDSDGSQPDKGDIKPNGVIGTIRRALGGY